MSKASTPPPDRHGRDATAVTKIPAVGWKDILWRTYSEVSQDHVLLIAAGVTFYMLLALVPALTAFVSIYGFFADPQTLDRHMDVLQGLVPKEGLGLVHEQLTRVTEQGQTKLGLTSLVGLAVALWSANSGMKALFEAMNIAYDEDEKRSFVRLTAITLAMTLATFGTVLLLLFLLVILAWLMPVAGFGAAAQWAASIGGIAFIALLLAGGLAGLYRWGPSRQAAQWRWITPGAVLAIVVILAASGLFTWYVASFGSYNAYGSLGAIFGLMTWLWITSIIVVAGAELNSEVEHQTENDTTTGKPQPMGSRGAAMADTLGHAYGAESINTGEAFEGKSTRTPASRSASGADRGALVARPGRETRFDFG